MVSISTGTDSKQDVQTPPEFMKAVENLLWAPIVLDLAASAHNKQHRRYFAAPDDLLSTDAEAYDSFAQDWAAIVPDPSDMEWGLCSILWLNPEYKHIAPWAKKCAETAPRLDPYIKIAMLVPASVGSNWFRDYVYLLAKTEILNGRITFIGHEHAFPKDLMLCVFDSCSSGRNSSISVWEWAKHVP